VIAEVGQQGLYARYSRMNIAINSPHALTYLPVEFLTSSSSSAPG
jgi:hypothetical protein